MQHLELVSPEGRSLRILGLGAHADDLEIGCGGTTLRLLKDFPAAEVRWVIFSGTAVRRREARASAAEFLSAAGRSRLQCFTFRESFFPDPWSAIKRRFEALRREFEPDLVFTHTRDDRHQDHRVLSDLAWNTFRDHLILEYEIPKFDGDLGQPNLFVPLSTEQAQHKAAAVVRHFASQRSKHWFTEETFLGLMRIRGVECAAPYAEAFVCRKGVLGVRTGL
jgi:LmbE family N-acetylglucosaminyl deacetylase